MMAGGWDNDYYTNNYLTDTCIGGCPINSHCEWGLCECNGGSTRRYGRCEKNWPTNTPPRPQNFDPFQTCSDSSTCQALDMNLICNTNLTTQGTIGKCECRRDMRWNAAEVNVRFIWMLIVLRLLMIPSRLKQCYLLLTELMLHLLEIQLWNQPRMTFLEQNQSKKV